MARRAAPSGRQRRGSVAGLGADGVGKIEGLQRDITGFLGVSLARAHVAWCSISFFGRCGNLSFFAGVTLCHVTVTLNVTVICVPRGNGSGFFDGRRAIRGIKQVRFFACNLSAVPSLPYHRSATGSLEFIGHRFVRNFEFRKSCGHNCQHLAAHCRRQIKRRKLC
jgi:hypothetical protein